jgi:hypothetical protein
VLIEVVIGAVVALGFRVKVAVFEIKANGQAHLAFFREFGTCGNAVAGS